MDTEGAGQLQAARLQCFLACARRVLNRPVTTALARCGRCCHAASPCPGRPRQAAQLHRSPGAATSAASSHHVPSYLARRLAWLQGCHFLQHDGHGKQHGASATSVPLQRYQLASLRARAIVFTACYLCPVKFPNSSVPALSSGPVLNPQGRLYGCRPCAGGDVTAPQTLGCTMRPFIHFVKPLEAFALPLAGLSDKS